MSRPLFLRLCLIDSLFGCALAAGAIAYRGKIHPVAVVAVAVVLAVFAAGAAVCLWLAWTRPVRDARGTIWVSAPASQRRRLLADVGELAEKLPGLALMGTAAGFIIALSGDTAQVQHRIAGAATGIVSTFVGVACWLVLSAQHRMLARRDEA